MAKKDEQIDQLVEGISALVGALEKGFACKGHGEPVTKHDLLELEKQIMSQITDITAGIQTNLDSITKDIAAIAAAGVGGTAPASDVAAVQTVATNVQAAATALGALVPPAAPAP
jgi:hypothetical protein